MTAEDRSQAVEFLYLMVYIPHSQKFSPARKKNFCLFSSPPPTESIGAKFLSHEFFVPCFYHIHWVKIYSTIFL